MIMKLLWTFLLSFVVGWFVLSTPAAREYGLVGWGSFFIFAVSAIGLIVTILLKIWK